ncbi:carbohydrate binding domain-containing protein [Rhizobium sp. RCC_161_2]|uniref:carbohydrate binding domain-containing protein n=1 Tax=Rhizobium sp. RCC_161_2 TaxID=3239219 RepID=UPI00352374A8
MKILILILNVLGFWLIADAAHADPISLAVSAISGFFGSVSIGKLILTVALNVGLSLIEKALTKKEQPRQAGAKLEISMGDDHPMSFVMGSYATAGQRKYAGSWGDDGKTPNAYFTDVIEIGSLPNYAGERGLTSVWIDDQEVGVLWEEPHPDGRGYPVQQYRVGSKDYLWIKFLDGAQSGPDAFLTAKFGTDPDRPWKSTMIGLGCQVVILTARYNTDLFSGIPSGLYQPHPVPLYDIRKDSSAGGNGAHRWDNPATWEPTSNPATMIYNLARGVYYGSEWVYGGQNIAAFSLPAANWMAAANACDAAVTLDDGSHEPAFRAGYEIQCDQQPLDVISELLKGCNGRMAEVGGVFKMLISTPGGAVYSFSDDDIVVTEEQDFQPFPSLSETYNAIEATYPEPSEKWATKDAPGRYNTDLEVLDGDRRLPAQIQLPAVPFANQVQRVGLAMIQDYRRFRVHQISLPPDAYPLEPNDVVSWTSERNGYAEKKFLVVKVEPQPNFLTVVTLKEVDPADYDWHSGLQLPIATGWIGPITPPSQPMTGWTVEPATIKDTGGIDRRPAIKISCAPDMDDVERVWVQVRLKESGAVVFDSDSTRYESPYSWLISGQWTLPNTDYEARGRYIPKSNRATTWSSWLSVTTPNILIQSGDVLDNAIIAAKIADAAVIASKIMDEAVTNLKLADAAVSTAKLQVAAVTAEVLANSAVISSKLADGAVTAAKLAAAAIDATKFASSIKPVEIVSALPASGNVEGRQVYLTTDGKLYRYHNNAWTAAVAATDINGILADAQIQSIAAAKVTGQMTDAQIAAVAAAKVTGTLVSSQIADAAITNTKLAALAVDAAKLADNAITTTKIADNAISTPKLQANSVVAVNIAAQAVTARSLVLQDWENLIPDNQMQASAAWPTLASCVINPATTQAFTSKGSIDYTYAAGAGYLTIVVGSPFAVVSGQQYFASVQVARTSGTQMGFWVRVHWLDANGALLSPDIYATIGAATGAANAVAGVQTFSATITPPSAAFGARVQIYVQRDLTDGNISFGGFSWLRRATANLLVDGSVVAAKIAADAVTATTIATGAVTADAIAANAVTAVAINAGSITTAKIAAGAITTSTIAAGAVTANELSANAVTAGKIAANAVTAGTIAAGAVSATQIAANAITSDKLASNSVTTDALAVGSGKNLLQNANFAAGMDCWAYGSSGAVPGLSVRIRATSETYAGKNNPTLMVYQGSGPTSGGYYTDVRWLRPDADTLAVDALKWGVSCTAGEWLEATAYVSAHRCIADLRIEWRAADGTVISYTTVSSNSANSSDSANPDNWPRLRTLGAAPAGAVCAAIHMRKRDTNAGQTDSYMFVNKPMLCRIPAGATEPTAWSSGDIVLITNGGIVASAVTADKIAANAITAGKIAANAVTAGTIAAGAITAATIAASTITGDKLAANTIGADQIAANAITAKQLVLTDFSNMVDNGWQTGTLDGWAIQNQQAFYVDSNAGSAAGYVLQSLGRDCARSNAITVTPGETYAFDVWVYNTDPNTASIVAMITTPSGANAFPVVVSTTTKNGWIRLQGRYAIPSGYTKLAMLLQVNKTAGTGSSCYWSKPVMRRAVSAELIVDGAITANKISVNSLDAITANLGAVNISSAVIGSLQVGRSNISAGAVTSVQTANPSGNAALDNGGGYVAVTGLTVTHDAGSPSVIVSTSFSIFNVSPATPGTFTKVTVFVWDSANNAYTASFPLTFQDATHFSHSYKFTPQASATQTTFRFDIQLNQRAGQDVVAANRSIQGTILFR